MTKIKVLSIITLALVFAATVGCSKLDWPDILDCSKPLVEAELKAVQQALASDQDVEQALTAVAEKYGPATVECAVQAVMSQAAARRASGDEHVISRGNTFLDKRRVK